MFSNFETDVIPTSAGDLSITFLGHASLLMVFNGMNIYLDPICKVADYASLPKADLVLVTHEHTDHFDLQALTYINTENTFLIENEICAHQAGYGIVLHNGDEQVVAGIPIKVIPAYNLVHQRPSGEPFHQKGDGNGYIMTFGNIKLYVAGDTEIIPEMKVLKDIEIAFLPMNLPYTMTPEMVADAAISFQPRILYPYHLGDTDVSKLVELLKDKKDIEVRIRKMK